MALRGLRPPGSPIDLPPGLLPDAKHLVKAMRWINATSPDAILRRVLEFLRCDINKLSALRRTKLVWDLRAISLRGLAEGEPAWHLLRAVLPAASPVAASLEPLDLTALQSRIAQGIREYFESEKGWQLPPPRSAALRLMDRAPRKPYPALMFDYGSEEDLIIVGVWNVVWRVGDRFRACRRCGTAFVAKKRQEYCTEPKNCSQKQRNEWKKLGTSRKEEEVRAARSEAREVTMPS